MTATAALETEATAVASLATAAATRPARSSTAKAARAKAETASDQPAQVWGHSPDTLYEVDPDTKAVSVIGKFSGCTQVIDVALDSTSNMFVTTQDGLYSVDKTSAKCTHIADGSYPNSLSFVPAGTVDPSVEALVGYVGDSYVRIDTGTGKMTTIGNARRRQRHRLERRHRVREKRSVVSHRHRRYVLVQ